MRDKEINSGNRVRKKNGFDAVYEEYHKMVFRIAYHYTCNREEAEEQFFGTLREKDEIECACRILAALKTKKRKWYNLAVYAYCNEMPRQEIADRMGMSLDAVMSTLTRIKDWIRKNYKDEFDHINT